MLLRESLEQREFKILSEKAAKSALSRGRAMEEEKCDLRTDFQRDRDRIIHSSSFRRLKHKTQVFLSPEGDYYRTRLTHTLEVAQIARTMARALRLNEDLTEAIALGHDLGHTPFGHAGERALDAIAPFGFKHYIQSVRVAEVLEKGGAGLNLTEEVLNGIACHTKGDERRSEKQQLTASALRISVLIGAPCAFGLTVLSEPILKLLYREASAESAAPLLTLLAPSSLFVCVLAITNAVLQSVGKAALPMYSMLTGAAAKSFAVWMLVPHIGIAAAPVSTCICYVIVTAMNLYFMMRCTGASLRFADTFLKPFAAAAVCAVSAYGMHRVFRLCLPDKAAVLPAIAGAAVVYLLCVKRMRILHSEDLVMLPGSRRIRKWLDIE